MTGIVVADTGPLIALGRVGRLKLLRDLYQHILIPPAVHDELHLGSGRPGAEHSAEALEQGWLQVRELSSGLAPSLSELVLIFDQGEAEAILLAEEVDCRFLLIDERKGQAIAKRRGVPVVGMAGVLLAAKKRGLGSSKATGPVPSTSTARVTRLAYLLGIQDPGLEGENRAPFAFLDLHPVGANRACFDFRDKFDAGKSLTGLGRGASHFRCRPTRTLRMSAQSVQQYENNPKRS